MTSKFAVFAAALALAGTAAFASTDVAALDANADGVLSMEELAVAYPALTADDFAAVDTDADGFASAEEVAAADEAGVLHAE
ncbi:EF-hand domain-containing protein [Actibacterium sp. XHP0104]|uniref:EF-hand domain-containing protein n=1 Tax=Actibacterium sp. XHP0104 TaxID=2984335 RepID=UPI0021E7E078|nr:EF-hand domain-containing protein [Actibacterium sp. XHP0104]MCV2880885.1 EF-hand domain-containing protein [Actibacterium sp. XHP0104]